MMTDKMQNIFGMNVKIFRELNVFGWRILKKGGSNEPLDVR
jgi:hypothetical protein